MENMAWGCGEGLLLDMVYYTGVSKENATGD